MSVLLAVQARCFSACPWPQCTAGCLVPWALPSAQQQSTKWELGQHLPHLPRRPGWEQRAAFSLLSHWWDLKTAAPCSWGLRERPASWWVFQMDEMSTAFWNMTSGTCAGTSAPQRGASPVHVSLQCPLWDPHITTGEPPLAVPGSSQWMTNKVKPNCCLRLNWPFREGLTQTPFCARSPQLILKSWLYLWTALLGMPLKNQWVKWLTVTHWPAPSLKMIK